MGFSRMRDGPHHRFDGPDPMAPTVTSGEAIASMPTAIRRLGLRTEGTEALGLGMVAPFDPGEAW
jgi:hypothetical protein